MSEKIVAERVTDTGVLVAGEWWNFSKFGKKPAMVDGGTYEVEANDFKGKKYIKQAREIAVPSGAAVAAATGNLTPSAKNERILVQGVVQACLQSPGLTGFAANAEEYLAAVEAAAERIVMFVRSQTGE